MVAPLSRFSLSVLVITHHVHILRNVRTHNQFSISQGCIAWRCAMSKGETLDPTEGTDPTGASVLERDMGT